MSLTVEAATVANAPQEAVWQILADFPNIANHVSSVNESLSTSPEPFAIGSTRSCKFNPIGSTDEKIIELEPGQKLVIELFNTKRLPIKRSTTTFSLAPAGAGKTRLTMTAHIEPKGGPLAGLVARRLRRRLPDAAKVNVYELAAAAEKLAPVTAGAS